MKYAKVKWLFLAFVTSFTLAAAITTYAEIVYCGPCTGPVACTDKPCDNFDEASPEGARSVKCLGDGVVSYCANTDKDDECESFDHDCYIVYCYSEYDCIGIRIWPCYTSCYCESTCGTWA